MQQMLLEAHGGPGGNTRSGGCIHCERLIHWVPGLVPGKKQSQTGSIRGDKWKSLAFQHIPA